VQWVVKPRYESELAFRVAGKMVARAVDVGAVVQKGDVLARLDEQDYRNKLKSAESDLAAADAVFVEAQGTEERYRQLLASGATTRALYDSALKNFRSAEAKRDRAQTAVDMARDQVNYSELHADFDGVVTAVGAEAESGRQQRAYDRCRSPGRTTRMLFFDCETRLRT
jgi:RND family efflux transporter MFP subunit